VIANGMNPLYGKFDPYHMAASAIDEAVRNCVAVGADPRRIAILDNFCWGDCERPETLGSLVRAALACHDLSIALETPFISGKDSLNNEFSYVDAAGNRQVIAIPPSLLISAIGQVEDISQCVTMDLKRAGDWLYLVGETKNELGGSHFALVNELEGGEVPTVNAERAKDTFARIHQVISAGLVAACHDLSEGGLAATAAEMAFAGGMGAEIGLPRPSQLPNEALLFSESNTRFLCEVKPADGARFEKMMADVPVARIGSVTDNTQLTMQIDGGVVIDAPIARLKKAWQRSAS
jgi:phosphoribosylformylglycinamidine synthase